MLEIFSKLDERMKQRICTIPSIAPVTVDPNQETEQDVMVRHDKFLRLPEKIQDKLLSVQVGENIYRIGQSFGLGLVQIASIARAIRNYYFGELPLEKFSEVFSREMGIDLPTAQKLSEVVIQKIINDTSFEKAYAEKVEELSLQKVLQKYPEAGEQLLTGNKIMLKDFPEEVRPSIKNWVSDYTSRLGYIRHDSIQRSQYLFQSPNTKALREEDREKLSFILRAFDENLPLSVNRDTRQIILPNFQTNKPRTIIPNQEAPDKKPQITDSGEQNNELNIQSAQFNFHQKMPFEMKKEDFQRPAPERITPRNLEVTKNEISQKPKIQSLAPPSPQKMIGSVPERQFYQPRTNLVSGISEETPNVNPKNVVNLKEL